MKKILLFILIWQFIFLSANSDKDARPENVKKIQQLNKLAKDHITEQEKASNYAYEAIKIAVEINDKSGEAKAWQNIGLIHYYQEQFEESIQFQNKALKIFTNIDDKLGIANTEANIAISYYNLKDYGFALSFLEKSQILYEELNDKTGEKIRDIGKEFGTTTGRPRRCGWLDLVMLKYSNRINGFSSLAITKLDVLSGLDKIKVAVKYTLSGKGINFPLSLKQLEKCQVEYKEFNGFEITGDEKSYEDLHENARLYLKFIELFLDVPISLVSIGPKRSETIIKKEITF